MVSNVAPGRILRLAPQLANQIAAGEVVERPASVAKELLENSLDAGASRVEVDVEAGGVKLVRVHDDGGGILSEDLPLAVSPHATSKITRHEDLLGITSLGFRGEALASIASVSRFSVLSRVHGEDSGWRLDSAGDLRPAAHPVGTTVEVRDLFYNVPARRKFLRAERTEFSHLEEVVKKVALGRFELALTLRHNGRTVLKLPEAHAPELRARRLAAVLGAAFAREAVPVEFEAAGIRLSGWTAAPGYSRSQADIQFFYLNGRIIKDRLVNHAVRQACSEWIEPGRFPAYVMYLELDPRQVDVNVHPTKHEVRFREARLVHDFLVAALRGCFEGRTLPGVDHPKPSAVAVPPESLSPSDSAQRQNHSAGSVDTGCRPLFPPRPAGGVGEAMVAYRKLAESSTEPSTEYLGIVGGRFVVGRTAKGLVVIDGLLSEKLRMFRHLNEHSTNLRRRPLLIPISIRCQRGWDKLIANKEPLRFGMNIESLGPDTAAVREIPAVFRGETMVASMAEGLLGRLASDQDPQTILEYIAETAATSQILGGESGRRLLSELAAGHLAPSLYRELRADDLLKFFQEGAQ